MRMFVLVLASGMLMSGCVAPPRKPAHDPAAEVLGLWRVDQARSEPILDRRKARLDFGADGRITGNTSCNSMHASYTMSGARIDIGQIITTQIGCPQYLLEQEDRILSALEAAKTARVREDGLLELRDADGRGVLRGTRFVDGEQ